MSAGSVAARFASPWGIAALGAVALVGAGIFAFLKYRNNGGAYQLGQDVASGAIDATAGIAKGAAVGAINAVSDALGIAQPQHTVTDVQRARELIGQYGWMQASRQVEARTLLAATWQGPAYYGNEGRTGLAALKRDEFVGPPASAAGGYVTDMEYRGPGTAYVPDLTFGFPAEISYGDFGDPYVSA